MAVYYKRKWDNWLLLDLGKHPVPRGLIPALTERIYEDNTCVMSTLMGGNYESMDAV